MPYFGVRRRSNFGLFSASPDSVNILAPPATVTIYGYDISTAYGMPQVTNYDSYGRRAASTTASAVASDGTWVQVDMPDLSYCYTGQFQLIVANRSWGGIEEIGYAVVNIWGRDRVDADGDGWFSDEECDDNDPFVNPGASPDCYGTYYDRNCNGMRDQDECYSGPCGGGDLSRPIEECPVY